MSLILKYSIGFAAVIVALTLFILPKFLPQATIGTGHVAKMTCSEIFVADRDSQAVLEQDYTGIDPLIEKITVTVDKSKKEVRTSLYGLAKRKAIYREEVGCTLVVGTIAEVAIKTAPAGTFLPQATSPNPALKQAVLKAFDDQSLSAPIDTRALLVIQNGTVVAEQYAPGFARHNTYRSWSMAKSITQALIGTMVHKNIVTIDQEVIPATGKDPAISIDQLLRMSSGLEFQEDYVNATSDALTMLHIEHDMGGYAKAKPRVGPPDSIWNYSSGTTNILSREMRGWLTGANQNYHNYPRTELFHKIGMSSAVFEVDPSGHFIGSSYIYANAHDWARFGLLYLNDGVWDETRLLPEGWIEYTTTPTAHSHNGYGAHFWLNNEGSGVAGQGRRWPGLPEDAYYAGGHEGQYVIIIPSKNAVIVRLGLTRAKGATDTVIPPLIKDIYDHL